MIAQCGALCYNSLGGPWHWHKLHISISLGFGKGASLRTFIVNLIPAFQSVVPGLRGGVPGVGDKKEIFYGRLEGYH